MTTRSIEIVFEPKYLSECDNSQAYWDCVVAPELETRAVEAWETKMSQAD